MRKVIIIIFMSLISSVTFSEVTFIKSNRTIIYYDNGKEIAKETFDKDNNSTIVGKIPDGITKEYYDKTVVSSETSFKDNKRNGLRREYYLASKKLMLEESWKDGKREWNKIYDNETGDVESESNYEDGRQLNNTLYYRNNESTTEYKYDRNGNLENQTSKHYTDKKLTAVSVFTGKKKVKEINYSDLDSAEYSEEEKTENIVSRIYGCWQAVCVKNYYDDGEIKSEARYKDGKLNGSIKEYYANGNLKREWNYKDGQLDGLDKSYFENGDIWIEKNYKNGKLNGLRKAYYSMDPSTEQYGGIGVIETYKNDVLINSRQYDTSGKQTLNQDYPYEAAFNDDNIEQGLSDTLTTSFYKTKIFTVVERKKMNEIIKEQKFQLTGCTKTECAVEIGKILNVKYMVVGSISKIGKEFTVNIRIVSVESSEVVIADMEKCSNETELIDTIKKVVENISGKKAFSADSKQNTIAILDLETKKD